MVTGRSFKGCSYPPPNIDPSSQLLAFLGIICGSVLLPRGQTLQTNAWCVNVWCVNVIWSNDPTFGISSRIIQYFWIIFGIPNFFSDQFRVYELKWSGQNHQLQFQYLVMIVMEKNAHFESKIDSWWEIHQCNRGGSLPTSLDSTGTRSMPVHQVAVAWQRKRPIVIWQCVPKKGVFHPLGTFLSFWSDFVVWLKTYMSIQQWLVPNDWGTLILFAAKLVFGHGNWPWYIPLGSIG